MLLWFGTIDWPFWLVKCYINIQFLGFLNEFQITWFDIKVFISLILTLAQFNQIDLQFNDWNSSCFDELTTLESEEWAKLSMN